LRVERRVLERQPNIASERQRPGVAIARAVLFKSRVLILDEPTNHLSVKETAKVLGFVRSLPARGGTGILISHNLEHVFQSCDRVVTMARGEIVFDKPVGGTNVDEISDALG
jgi:simple sugar transport system ATP-binding protein